MIIPDIYVRKHVKCIVDMLFKQMNFASVIIHQVRCICNSLVCMFLVIFIDTGKFRQLVMRIPRVLDLLGYQFLNQSLFKLLSYESF